MIKAMLRLINRESVDARQQNLEGPSRVLAADPDFFLPRFSPSSRVHHIPVSCSPPRVACMHRRLRVLAWALSVPSIPWVRVSLPEAAWQLVPKSLSQERAWEAADSVRTAWAPPTEWAA